MCFTYAQIKLIGIPGNFHSSLYFDNLYNRLLAGVLLVSKPLIAEE